MSSSEKNTIEMLLYKKQYELKIPIWDYLFNKKRWLKASLFYVVLIAFFGLNHIDAMAWEGVVIIVLYNIFYHQNSLTSPLG